MKNHKDNLRKIRISEKTKQFHKSGELFIKGTIYNSIEELTENYIASSVNGLTCPLKSIIKMIEKSIIEHTLNLTLGNQAAAAEILKEKKTTLNVKIKRLNIPINKQNDVLLEYQKLLS